MERKSKVYRCYSANQKAFLISKGNEYLDVIEDKNGKTLWLFLKSYKLDEALTQWSNNNPNKRS